MNEAAERPSCWHHPGRRGVGGGARNALTKESQDWSHTLDRRVCARVGGEGLRERKQKY